MIHLEFPNIKQSSPRFNEADCEGGIPPIAECGEAPLTNAAPILIKEERKRGSSFRRALPPQVVNLRHKFKIGGKTDFYYKRMILIMKAIFNRDNLSNTLTKDLKGFSIPRLIAWGINLSVLQGSEVLPTFTISLLTHLTFLSLMKQVPKYGC